MPQYFQDRFGGDLPASEPLVGFSSSATMVARGENTLSEPTMKSLLSRSLPTSHRELQAVNNHLLRVIIECLAKSDPISHDAAKALSSFSIMAHELLADPEKFVFANIDNAKSPALRSLRGKLAEHVSEPEKLTSFITHNIKFSQFPPTSLGDEHVLLEDTFARCAVSALLKGEYNLEVAQRLARIALAFRSNQDAVLPAKQPEGQKAMEANQRAKALSGGFACLFDWGRRLSVESGIACPFEVLLKNLSDTYKDLSQILSLSNPFRQLSYFFRGELIINLLKSCDELECCGSDTANEANQELRALVDILDLPTTLTFDNFMQYIERLSGLPAGYWKQEEVFVLESNRRMLGEIQRKLS